MGIIKNYIKNILYTVLFVLLTCNGSMAIENVDVQNNTAAKNAAADQVYTNPKNKKHWFKKNKKSKKQDSVVGLDVQKDNKLIGKISFDEVMQKAEEHAYDLKIADFQILIAKQGIKGARADYFPKLNFNMGTEYTKNFRNDRESTVMTIGEAYINPYTRYQSVLGITLTYNIFDFGVRGNNLKAAKEDVVVKELQEKQKFQELNLNVVDTYSKILMLTKQIELNNKILQIEEKTFEYKTRLYNAKELSQMEYDDAIVKLAGAKKRISELKSTLQESVNWLAFYTGEQYDTENLKVGEFKKSDFDVNAFQDYTKCISWKIHEHSIKKKEFELRAAKHANYPKINAYSKYYIYGSDNTSYPDSFSNIKPSNFTVGVSVNTQLFDGMKNRANIGKVKLELQQLQVERDKDMAQFMAKLATLRSNLIYLEEQSTENDKMIKALDDKEKSTHRLVAKRLVSPIEENDVKVQVLQQQIEADKNKITSEAIVKGIQILTQEF